MTFQEFLEDQDYETRPYSGRGMFGKTCLAVTVDDLTGAAFDIRFRLGAHSHEIWPNGSAKWDNLGRGFIIYWPHEPYKEPNE